MEQRRSSHKLSCRRGVALAGGLIVTFGIVVCGIERLVLQCTSGDFEVHSSVPQELRPWFNRCSQVFGVHVFASPGVDEWALQHVARVLAKFLDQDEDGHPDGPEVLQQMIFHKAAVLLLRDSAEYKRGVGRVADYGVGIGHGVIKNDQPAWNCTVSDVWVVVELFQSETIPDLTPSSWTFLPRRASSTPVGASGVEDGAWEELFHLISHVGLGCADPEKWGFRADARNPDKYPPSLEVYESVVSRALDVAMGDCGASYSGGQKAKKTGCSYYYSDATCLYPCLINEYLYQVWRTRLGGRDSACEEGLQTEYSFCTRTLLEANDPAGFELASSPALPRELPSGYYRPRTVLASLDSLSCCNNR